MQYGSRDMYVHLRYRKLWIYIKNESCYKWKKKEQIKKEQNYFLVSTSFN